MIAAIASTADEQSQGVEQINIRTRPKDKYPIVNDDTPNGNNNHSPNDNNGKDHPPHPTTNNKNIAPTPAHPNHPPGSLSI